MDLFIAAGVSDSAPPSHERRVEAKEFGRCSQLGIPFLDYISINCIYYVHISYIIYRLYPVIIPYMYNIYT